MTEEAGNNRRFLVAVDESEESMYTLTWCLKNLIFRNSKDTLILLYIKPYRYTPPLGATGRIDNPQSHGEHLLSSEINDTTAASIEKVKNLCKDIPHVKVEIGEENVDPRDVICDMAQKLAPDVLVMGSHGYGHAERIFLGSVSDYCAETVKCPILIVKKPDSSPNVAEVDSFFT